MPNEDYKEMLLLLTESNVDFILVGAYALAAHGYPRSTGDIDIWINPIPENAEKVYECLVKFGAPLFDLKPEDLCVTGNVFQIGIAPRRIDILTGISGVKFQDAKKDLIKVEMEGIRLPFLSFNHLLINKETSGRDKDIIDLKRLRKQE